MILPQGWTEVSLGDVATSNLGKMLDKAKRTAGTPMRYLRNQNVRWDGFDLEDVYEMPFESHELERFALRNGDLLVCEGGEPGRAAVWVGGYQMMFQKALHRVRPSEALEARYLLFRLMLDAATGSLSDYFTGTTIKHLTGVSLERYRFQLPPVNEQRRIVAKLDAIFERTRAAKSRFERVPALLNKLKRSVLAAACAGRLTNESSANEIPSTWHWVTLQDLVVPGGIFDGARDHGSGTAVAQNLRTADYTDSGVRVVRLENLAHLAFIEDKRTFISEEKFIGLKQSEVREGDLLFGSFIDEQVRVCRLPRLGVPSIAKADCFCVRPDVERVLPEYLLLQLACQRTRDSIESQAHGLGRLRITTKQLRAIRVPLCSTSEQQRIVDKVTAQFAFADQILRSVQSGSQRTEATERAALAKAFRGELVEQDPSDESASALLDRIRRIARNESDASRTAERKPRSPRSREPRERQLAQVASNEE